MFWILLPAILSGAGLGLLRYPKILKWGGSATSLLLGLSAALLPVNQEFTLLFWQVQLSDQLLVFGRRFVLSAADRPIVILLFWMHLFWMLIFNPRMVPVQFVPFSLAGIVLILTAYAVDPIFYGALFFAFLALVNVVMLSPPGKEPTPGVLRLLIYQILGMLFILFAAWLASWIGFNRGDELMLSRSLLILALGFSFLLSLFPFISWIPMVGEKNHPFLTGYLFTSYFLGVFTFGSRFITEAGWLTGGMNLQAPLQFAGALMLALGGILALFSDHLGRISAALVIAGIGRSLLAFSLFQNGFSLYFAMVLIEIMALGVWSLALTNLREVLPDLGGESVLGATREWPVITSGMMVGYFTLAGLPLLGGFPLYLALGAGLHLYPDWINVILVLGTVGLLVRGLRLVNVLLEDAGRDQVLILDNQSDKLWIISLSVLLFLLGLFPQGLMQIARQIALLIAGT
jgi:NADH-quinone oxidoreductase subunit N